ncbi:hypothetical protein AAZX31_12G106800 [Glycine max]
MAYSDSTSPCLSKECVCVCSSKSVDLLIAVLTEATVSFPTMHYFQEFEGLQSPQSLRETPHILGPLREIFLVGTIVPNFIHCCLITASNLFLVAVRFFEI